MNQFLSIDPLQDISCEWENVLEDICATREEFPTEPEESTEAQTEQIMISTGAKLDENLPCIDTISEV